MSSVKCPHCNLTNWSTAITCKRCGGFLQEPGEGFAAPAAPQNPFTTPNFAESEVHQQTLNATEGAPQTQWTPPATQQNYQQQNHQYQQANYQYQSYQQQPYYGYYQQPKNLKSGIAVASMIMGILGFVTMIFVVGLLVAPIGLILGIIALVKANKKPDLYGGKGFAIAGIVTSSIVVLFIPIVAAIAVPNLLAARRAANEGSAISTLKTLSNAEATFMASSAGKCGDIQALIATKLVDVSLAKGEKSGYRFLVINFPSGGCEIHATPLTTSQGTRSFYYSTEDGVLRGGPKKGLPADKNDFPIKSDMPERNDQPEKRTNPLPAGKPNEMATISALRTIHSAEMTYAATVGQGQWGSLQTLALQGLIRQDLSDSEEYGYRFKVAKMQQTGWELYATPTSSEYGSRSFYVGSDGVIRGAAKNGLPADKNDPSIN